MEGERVELILIFPHKPVKSCLEMIALKMESIMQTSVEQILVNVKETKTVDLFLI